MHSHKTRIVVVMAAGKGKRMQPLTFKIPKALAKFKNKPLIEHVLTELQTSGIRKTIIVIGYKGQQVKKYLGKKFGKMKLEYVWQKKQLGTAHAVRQALKKLKQKSFLVVSADVLVRKKDIQKLMNSKGDAVLGLRMTKQPERYGIVESVKGRIRGIIEKPKKYKRATAWINVGVYKFNANASGYIRNVKRNLKRKEFELTDVISDMLRKRKNVQGIKFTKKVYDIGSLKDLQQK